MERLDQQRSHSRVSCCHGHVFPAGVKAEAELDGVCKVSMMRTRDRGSAEQVANGSCMNAQPRLPPTVFYILRLRFSFSCRLF
mmetsp:Transcript_59597/g.158571  ORF Transcript_59597/g.158571 Transcript_59597/m.158571 type:complete len:83 (+) Transcript_59597:1960-2208(+)